MAEKTTFTAYLRRKITEFGWLSSEEEPQSSLPSTWEPDKIDWWSGLRDKATLIFTRFHQWIRSRGWGYWHDGDQQSISASEVLPGFMETAESTARVEFDPGRQTWTTHLDYSQKSLACHLEVVNEEATPVMQQILSIRQFRATPPD